VKINESEPQKINMDSAAIIKKLKSLANPANVEGMARFGISSEKTFGISIPLLRSIAKETGKNHKLALGLWDTGYHEARILASMIDIPENVTDKQMEKWVRDFDSWDVCDQCCSNLFDKTPYAYSKIKQWSKAKEEFVKRAAFALLAVMAVHDKKANDEVFIKFFPLIKRESTDERNYVRKAVNWSLRQIGKRNKYLNKESIKLAKEIYKSDNKTAKWIAADALRELKSKQANLRKA
jgi:3-methyladenine DNA glycosylase AlkD